VVGVDAMTHLFVRYAWAARVSPSKIMEQVYSVNERFRPRFFGVEANAQQSLFAGALQREAKWREMKLPIVPVNQPTKQMKDFRIRSILQPVMAQGRLFIPDSPEFYELRLEVQSFPLSATKDLIDALASAISLVPAQATSKQDREEIEELAAYLRASGAPPWYIEQRIAQVLREAAA